MTDARVKDGFDFKLDLAFNFDWRRRGHRATFYGIGVVLF
jgi:hypothetical protein